MLLAILFPMVRPLPLALVLATAICAFAVPTSAQAQRAPRRVSRGTTRPAPAPKASAVPKRIPVLLVVDSAADDSVHAIIARDLDYGDRVAVLDTAPPDSGAAAATVVRATVRPEAVSLALLDQRTSTVRQQRAFPVPVVPASRVTELADSVHQALTARRASRDSALARFAVTRDSLRALLARKRPHFWTRGARERYDSMNAVRDSALRIVLRLDTLARQDLRTDSVTTDSALGALVVRDSILRDSVAIARRWAIHGVADHLQAWLTGQRGFAQSRVTYVSNGDIHIIDADGANDHTVLRGRKALSPSWRHDGRAIAYSDLTDAGTQVAWIDLISGEVHLLDATKRGLNITPVYSPDDRWLAFATGDEIRTTIVAVRPDTVAPLHRITGTLPFDCESPTFSPDGSRIAYVSARPKLPEIYSARLDGTDERLETPISTRKRLYRTSPDWSPDGTAIAFEEQHGNFQVYMVTRATHALRPLTNSAENEDPTWAPDSRHLAITTTRHGTRTIYILDTVSGRLRQLTHTYEGRLAAWSPILTSSH